MKAIGDNNYKIWEVSSQEREVIEEMIVSKIMNKEEGEETEKDEEIEIKMRGKIMAAINLIDIIEGEEIETMEKIEKEMEEIIGGVEEGFEADTEETEATKAIDKKVDIEATDKKEGIGGIERAVIDRKEAIEEIDKVEEIEMKVALEETDNTEIIEEIDKIEAIEGSIEEIMKSQIRMGLKNQQMFQIHKKRQSN